MVQEEKRDFSLREQTHFRQGRNLRSQERMPKKKSACSVRNDGWSLVRLGRSRGRRQVRREAHSQEWLCHKRGEMPG